jgi:hypothetical protein
VRFITRGSYLCEGYFVPGAGTEDFEIADSAASIVYSGLPGAFTGEAAERILEAVKSAWKRVLKYSLFENWTERIRITQRRRRS